MDRNGVILENSSKSIGPQAALPVIIRLKVSEISVGHAETQIYDSPPVSNSVMETET